MMEIERKGAGRVVSTFHTDERNSVTKMDLKSRKNYVNRGRKNHVSRDATGELW